MTNDRRGNRVPAGRAAGALRAFATLGLLLTGLTAHGAQRLWGRAVPAAGVQFRSAPALRACATGPGGSSAVGIYQVSSNGTSTLLGTLTPTPAGSCSQGSYTLTGTNVVYWQYAKLPAASTSPPAVVVTFYNDVPAIPLASIYYPSPPQTPFAATDPSLILNLDLRKGAPAGWTVTGSGTFDATNGYVPGTGAASGVANTLIGAFNNTNTLPQGTLAVRVQRTALSIDNSFGSHFWDSTGNTLNATTQNRQLFQARSNTAPWALQLHMLAGPIPQFEVIMQTASMPSIAAAQWLAYNSHYVAGYQDPTYADVVYTWYQNQYYAYVDGHLFAAGTLGDVPIYQMFEDICIGNFNGTGTANGAPFGAYAIQQVQLSGRFLGPLVAGPPVGLLPDSFAVAYTQRLPVTATGTGGNYLVSDVDAAQNALDAYTRIPALFQQPGQTPAFLQIQALMFRNYGFYPPVYNAGDPGHGYAQSLSPVDDAYIAALNKAGPVVVMAGGTVNDVSAFRPSDATLVGDTEAFLNRLVLGGGTRIAAPPNPALEQVLYLETLSSQGVPGGGAYPQPAYGTESQSIIALTRAGLAGFKPAGGVGFSYITAREWWDESPDYATYLYGTAPASAYNAAGGVDYQNIHPDATGYSIVAAHLYAPVSAALLTTNGADLSVTGTSAAVGKQGSTVSLTVANAGPLTASGVVLTAVLPGGVSYTATGSSSSCSQSGNTVSCAIGTIASGASVPVVVALQSQVSPGAIAFSVGSGSGNDPVAANNVALITPALNNVLVPAMPVDVVATGGTGQVTLTWDAAAGAASYSVYTGISAGGETSKPALSGLTGTSATLASLNPSTIYYITVVATNPAGSSPPSAETSALTLPAAPTGVVATAQAGAITLNWDASAGATSYQVLAGWALGAESPTPVQTGLTGTSTTLTGLSAGATYYLTVQAVNATGASLASAQVQATVPDPNANSGGGGALDAGTLLLALLPPILRRVRRRARGRADDA